MKRSQLKSIANKTCKDIGLYNFWKHWNLVANLKRKEISKFFVNIKWQPVVLGNCKPYFSNKGIKNLANIILSDKESLILKELEVVPEFNIHFNP